MKLIKNIFVIATILLFTGCDKFLEEDPPNFLDPEKAYRTEDDIFQALVGAYDRLGTGSTDYYKRRFFYMVHFASDEMRPNNLGSDQPLDDFTYTSNDVNVSQAYQRIYWAIAAANAVIDNVSLIENIDESTARQFEAEAKFLRALHHFNLVRLWGPVIVRKKQVASIEDAQAPRTSVAEVYDFIIEDLTFAKDNMAASNETGRATSGAAAALLAKVYLTRAGSEAAQSGDYQACLDACNEVIGSGEYQLTADFEKAIGKEDAFNSESIFEFISTRVGPTGNDELSIWGVFTLPNTPFTRGLQYNSINPAYADQAATPGTSNLVAETGFFSKFDPRDYRREQTFVYWATTPEGDSIGYNAFATAAPHCPQKFVDATANTDRSGYSFSANLQLLRYADVILMKAEALNELNQIPDAVAELNKIRKRARDGDGDGPWVETGFPEDVPTTVSQADLRDLILEERAIELAFEGHRWFDLARTNRLISTLQAQGKAIQDRHKLFPIPETQLQLQGTLLTQNPGW